MSHIIIETFTRGGGNGGWSSYVALAHYEGQIVANGGVGSGDSERSAAQEAVNSLFTREEEREAAKSGFIAERSDLGGEEYVAAVREHAVATTAPVRSLGVRYTGSQHILEALQTATAENWKLWLEYEDSTGNYTEREVIASGLDERNGRLGFRTGGQMLVAIDTEKDEPRHFLLSRIKAVTGPRP